MAVNKNITMREFNGTDYDTLYPKTTSEQLLTPVPMSKGGTGITENPNLQVNLGSENADYVFKQAPRPGIYGLLAVGHGGTGVTNYQALANQLSPYIISGARWQLKLEQDFLVGASGSGASSTYEYNISNFCTPGSKVMIFLKSRDGYQTRYSGDSFCTVGITIGGVVYTAIEATSDNPTSDDGMCENYAIAEFPGVASGTYFGYVNGYSDKPSATYIDSNSSSSSGIYIQVQRSAFASGGNHMLLKVFQYS